MSEIEQQEVITYQYCVSVRFHSGKKSYTFGCEDQNIRKGDWVVVETAQGHELAEVQSDAVDTNTLLSFMTLKPVIRVATTEDRNQYVENLEYAKRAMEVCQEEVNDLKLEMNLQSCTYSLNRSKVLFVYVSEQRVDFRELLKRLSVRLHCRIELRQIGERDKAKSIGGIGMCGRETCCSRFKTHFDVISINMAKNQLLAINIDKLSGVCGKLMCCLKYEDQDYKELTEGLPKMGTHVEYEGDIYRVSSMNVLSNEARIENNITFQNITIDELKEKAAVRKGVAMPKREDIEQKQPPKQNKPKPKPRNDEPIVLAHEEKPKQQKQNKQAKPQKQRQDRKQEPKQENKNITVRSFKSNKAKDV